MGHLDMREWSPKQAHSEIVGDLFGLNWNTQSVSGLSKNRWWADRP